MVHARDGAIFLKMTCLDVSEASLRPQRLRPRTGRSEASTRSMIARHKMGLSADVDRLLIERGEMATKAAKAAAAKSPTRSGIPNSPTKT